MMQEVEEARCLGSGLMQMTHFLILQCHPEIYQFTNNTECLSVHIKFRRESSSVYKALTCVVHLEEGGGLVSCLFVGAWEL